MLLEVMITMLNCGILLEWMHLYNHLENALHVKGKLFYQGRDTVQDYPVNTDQTPFPMI